MSQKKINKSDFLDLNKRDFIRGLIVAALGGFTTATVEVLSTGISLDRNTLSYLLIGLLSGITGYLGLNYSTDNKGEFLPKKKQIVNKKK